MAEANLGAIPATDAPTPAAPYPTEPATPSVQPDSFAGGRYRVERFLGEGGKKRVYLAHDELLDRDVAFALIKTEGLDEVGRERVVREAQAMGRMGVHPHIVSILDFGDHEGVPYVVTELMGGGDVEGLLEDAEGALSLGRSLDIAKATADGLVFAHEQGVVHRDLKPGNVWLTSDGRREDRRLRARGRRGALAADAARDDGRDVRLHAAGAGSGAGGDAAGRPLQPRSNAL